MNLIEKQKRGRRLQNFFAKPADVFVKLDWLFTPDSMEYFKDNRQNREGGALISFPIIQQRNEQVPNLIVPMLSLDQLSLT